MGEILKKIVEKTKRSGKMFAAGFGFGIDGLSCGGEVVYKGLTNDLKNFDKPEYMTTLGAKSLCTIFDGPAEEDLEESVASAMVTGGFPSVAGCALGMIINGSTMFIPAYILAATQSGREAMRLSKKLHPKKPMTDTYALGSD